MMRPGMLDADSGSEPPSSIRKQARMSWAALAIALLCAAGCGAAGMRLLGGSFDYGTMRQPLEVSLQRAVEIRESGSRSDAQLTTHYCNILNRVQEGIATLVDAARRGDAHSDWARRSLASIRQSAEDPLR